MGLSNTVIKDKDASKSVKIRFDLKEILQEYGLNINDLHEALESIGAGISKQTLYGYQRDADSRRPSLGNLEYIAAALSEQAAMSFNIHDILQFETTSSRTKGLKAQRDGAFDDAIELYTQALQEHPKVQEQRAHLLCELAKARVQAGGHNLKQARAEYTEAINLFQECLDASPTALRSDIWGLVQAHIGLAECLMLDIDVETSVQHLEKALRLLREQPIFDTTDFGKQATREQILEANALSSLGLAYYRQGLLQKAVKHFFLALNIVENQAQANTEMVRLRATTLRYLGNAYASLDVYEQAELCHRTALHLHTQENMQLQRCYVLCDLAVTYRLQGASARFELGDDDREVQTELYQKALFCHHQGLKIKPTSGAAYALGRHYLERGYLFYLQAGQKHHNYSDSVLDDEESIEHSDDRAESTQEKYEEYDYDHAQEYYEKAEANITKAISYFENQADSRSLGYAYLGLARTYRQISLIMSFIAPQRIVTLQNQAEEAFIKAVQLFRKVKDWRGLKHSLNYIGRFYYKYQGAAQLSKALSSYNEALNLYENEARYGDSDRIHGFVLLGLGAIHLETEYLDLEKARAFFEKALQCFRPEHRRGLSYAYIGLGDVCCKNAELLFATKPLALQQEVKVINLLREARTYYRTASYGFNYINDPKGKGRNKRRGKKVMEMLKTLQS